MAEVTNKVTIKFVVDDANASTRIGAIKSAIDELNNRASQLTATLTDVSGGISDVGDVSEDTADETEDLSDKTDKERTSMTSLQRVLKGLKLSLQNVTKGISKVIRAFGRIAFYRSIRFILSSIVKGFKEGTDAAYQYSKAIGGDFAKNMDALATSFTYAKNSLGGLASSFINLITPAVQVAIDRFVDFVNLVNQVIARINGQNTWTKAIKTQQEYAAATNSSAKANEKLKRSLLGIDELNVMSSDTSSSGTSSAGSYAFEEVAVDGAKMDGVIDKLKTIATIVGSIALAWKSIDIATTVAKLAGITIPASTVAAIGLIAAGIGLFVAGILEWISVGDISTKAFYELAGGIALVSAGLAIVVGLPALIVGAIAIAVVAIGKWGDEIARFFDNVRAWGVHFIDNARKKINEFFDNAINKVKSFSPALAGFIERIKISVNTGLDFVKDLFTYFTTTLSNISKLIYNVFHGNWNSAMENMKTLGKNAFSALGNFFLDLLINPLIRLTESFINFFIRKANIVIDGLNLLGAGIKKIDEVKFDTLSLETTKSRAEKGTKWALMEKYATGGFPTSGRLFFANENGTPELVGQFGNQTAVANNYQIIEGIEGGVRNANDDVITAIYSMASQIVNAVNDKDTGTYIDGVKLGKRITKSQTNLSRMYGVGANG